ncbi:MAG: O-antigen ligase family protein [Bacteroidales bacterium]
MIDQGKLDLNKVNQLLGYIVILFAPLDRYLLDIPFFINLSIYRVILILLVFGFLFQALIRQRLLGRLEFYLLIIFYVIGMFIGIVQSQRLGGFSAYFLNEIMGLSLVVVFVNIYSRDDITKLLKVFLLSFVFPVIISIYVYYVFFYEIRLVNTLPLSDILPFHKTIEFDTRSFRSGFFPRLGLPYSTSPYLALVSSAFLFISFIYYSGIKRFTLIVPILIIMIGTLTRTVIVSVFFTMIIYYLFVLNDKGIKLFIIKKRQIFIFLGILLLFILVVNFVAFDALKERFTSKSNITEDRHYILYIEAFYIIAESFKNFLLGIGDGNVIFREGVYTYLPPDGVLNSYLTVFVHRGILGFFLTISLYFYLLGKLIVKRNWTDKISYALLFSYINVLIAFNFYELRYINAVWILMAIIAVFIIGEKAKYTGRLA